MCPSACYSSEQIENKLTWPERFKVISRLSVVLLKRLYITSLKLFQVNSVVSHHLVPLPIHKMLL